MNSILTREMFYGNTKTEKMLDGLHIITICLAKLYSTFQTGHEETRILLF